ncbi:MAG TPA: protein phosphatase 2C domain-containing protein [Gemmatimonadales bacterium]|jgi:protein phosphatase
MIETTSARKPMDEEIDVYGLTHPGKVRAANQDHFLLATLNRKLEVLSTSLPSLEMPSVDARIAFLAMIADGVGGAASGEQASRLALEEATQYLSQCTDCYYQSKPSDETFIETLQEAASRAHERVVTKASENPDDRGMATTLTLWIGVWPWAYVLQVGDSRYYLYRDGHLTQLTRDQTMAQELIDQGVMARSAAMASRWANTLSSAIGGRQTAPVVTRVPSDWRYIHLLCSDGLTKHVPDERIAERLREMKSAKATCEALLQDALDGGGTDNISIIVGRAVERKGDPA